MFSTHGCSMGELAASPSGSSLQELVDVSVVLGTTGPLLGSCVSGSNVESPSGSCLEGTDDREVGGSAVSLLGSGLQELVDVSVVLGITLSLLGSCVSGMNVRVMCEVSMLSPMCV